MFKYFRNSLMAGFILAASVTVAAAQAGRPAPVDPPAECYCEECGMYVKGEAVKFASEFIMKKGSPSFFCDLGDLFLHYEVSKKRADIAAIFVKDYNTGAWTDGKTAWYLAGSKVKTPMRYGILAFKDKAAAAAFMKKGGGKDILSFDEVLASKVYRR